MAGTGDEAAAAGDGGLRASRDDREQVVELLKSAFVEDRLTKEELEARTGRALTSRTHADLAALTADLPAVSAGLPAGLTAARPRQPARSRAGQRSVRPGGVLAVSTALYVGLWPLAIVVPRDHEGDARVGLALVLAGGLVYAAVLLVVVACLLDSRQKDRPSGQPPQRPVSQLPQRPASQPPQRQAPRTPTPQRPPAQTPLRPVSGGPDGRHPSADRGQGHTAEAARSDSWPPPRRCHRGHRYTIGYVGR